MLNFKQAKGNIIISVLRIIFLVTFDIFRVSLLKKREQLETKNPENIIQEAKIRKTKNMREIRT